MKKYIICILTLVFLSQSAFAIDIWNKLDQKEYPDSNLIMPDKINSKDVISGSISKGEKLNLNSCIRLALGNNPQIVSAMNDILISDSKLKQIWSNFFPSFSWQTSYAHIKQLQLSDAFGRNLQFDYYLLGQISLEQMLYDFGVTQNKATIQRLNYDELKKTFQAIVNAVIYNTKIAYFKLQLAYEDQITAKETVEKFELFYNQAKALYLAGMNPKLDVTIAQANLSNAKLRLIQADNAVNLAIVNLNNVIGIPKLGNYKISETLKYKDTKITFESVIKTAIESRPELKIAQIKVESARQNIKLAYKAFFPEINFDAQYQRGGKHWNSNDGFTIGGYLVFPVINVALITNSINQAKFEYDKQLANAKKIQNDVYLELQRAYLTLEEKKQQIPQANIQLKQAKENYEVAFGMYKAGESSPIEVKDSEITLRNAKFTLNNSIYEYNSALAALEKAMGKNIFEVDDTIHLKLKD